MFAHQALHLFRLSRIATHDHPYKGPRNEQFDLIVSNPPFSIKMSEDEKDGVGQTFIETGSAASEKLFVERWY